MVGTGPPVVMVHGFSDSLVDWYEAGYVDALRDDYQLVMIDCLGHGLSDKPHAQEAYTMEMRVADILAVMDELHIDAAHYWGYSMGGRIGFGVVESAPERVLGMLMAGIDQHGTDARRFHNRIGFLWHGMDRYLESFEARFSRMEPDSKRSRFLENDYLAMIASTLALRDHVRDYSDVAKLITMPCLFYDGDIDAFHDNARSFAEGPPEREVRLASGAGPRGHAHAQRSGTAACPRVPFADHLVRVIGQGLFTIDHLTDEAALGRPHPERDERGSYSYFSTLTPALSRQGRGGCKIVSILAADLTA